MNLFINHHVSYFLNVAVFGLVFSIAALWASDYIIYGFVTFIYGITGHVIDRIVEKSSTEVKNWINGILFLAWIVVILVILF